MKKTLYLILASVLFLCGCSEAEEEPPAPITDYVLSDESSDEILALAELPQLSSVDGSGSREYEALIELSRLRPDCDISWVYDFGGTLYPSNSRSLKAVSLDGLEDALRFLPQLETVDLIDSPAVLEDLDRYYEIRPDIFYYWSFDFNGVTINTDIRCFSTLRSGENHRFSSQELYPLLKYCTKLRALDLGHNDLTDLSLIGNLSELEVLILADNPNLIDAAPLGRLHSLIYLEFFMNSSVQDFSFLNSMEKLEDLNLCYCPHLESLDFLSSMPNINFLLVKFTALEREEFERWCLALPDAKLVRNGDDIQSCGSGWRETERNALIRRNFTNWRNISSYESYDSVVFDSENPVFKLTA